MGGALPASEASIRVTPCWTSTIELAANNEGFSRASMPISVPARAVHGRRAPARRRRPSSVGRRSQSRRRSARRRTPSVWPGRRARRPATCGSSSGSQRRPCRAPLAVAVPCGYVGLSAARCPRTERTPQLPRRCRRLACRHDVIPPSCTDSGHAGLSSARARPRRDRRLIGMPGVSVRYGRPLQPSDLDPQGT